MMKEENMSNESTFLKTLSPNKMPNIKLLNAIKETQNIRI